MQLGRLPVRRSDILLADEDTGSLLIDTELGTTHRLNPAARAVWELCDGATTLGELVDAICQVFAVPHEVARRDVATTLEQLQHAGLVSWSSPDRTDH